MESRQIISTMPDHQHDIGESFQEQRTIPIGSARDEGNTTIPADDYTNTGVAPSGAMASIPMTSMSVPHRIIGLYG